MQRIISPPLTSIDKLRPPLTAGEKLTLDSFLRCLPEKWEIYMQPHLNGMKPDFVLLNPEAGIAVYEVKDWNLHALPFKWEEDGVGEFRLLRQNKNGKWYREEDPLKKIFYYKKQILELYAPSLRNQRFGDDAFKTGVFLDVDYFRKEISPHIIQKHIISFVEEGIKKANDIMQQIKQWVIQ